MSVHENQNRNEKMVVVVRNSAIINGASGQQGKKGMKQASKQTNLTGRRSKMMTGKTILTYAQGLKPKKHMTPSCTN